MDLTDVHSFVKSLDGLNMINEESSNMLVDYIVDNGYDAEDLAKQVGLPKATSLLCRLCCVEGTTIKNQNFIVHLEDFIVENLAQFTRH